VLFIVETLFNTSVLLNKGKEMQESVTV